MADVKPHEYSLLNEIARDPLVTQAGLSAQLGIAVGSVNWYVKRLIQRGWIKVSHLDRTRLKYDLTRKGMAVFTQRAVLYARDSLKVYRAFRDQAVRMAEELKARGVTEVFLPQGDEVMDIMRLTCIENGIGLRSTPGGVEVRAAGKGFEAVYGHSPAEG
ncbi:MAG TPA: winged helix-turn-helix transcriptional regulator [Anaerolineae bacterium]|nr:winged helix-turn-helix transcriptional regulator [Anaerolineae bacterium]